MEKPDKWEIEAVDIWRKYKFIMPERVKALLRVVAVRLDWKALQLELR